jgi:hypothetical protein
MFSDSVYESLHAPKVIQRAWYALFPNITGGACYLSLLHAGCRSGADPGDGMEDREKKDFATPIYG